MTTLEEAWAELDAANATLGWLVGRPQLHDDVRGAEHWQQWAHDAREKPKAGKRRGELTAKGQTEVICVSEMARCLREMAGGRSPP
jgi:hypothetical protein